MVQKSILQKSKEMLDRINKRKADADAKKSGLKLEEGETELRFMPSFNDEGEWIVSGLFHYGFSETFLCPTTYGEECPACEFVLPFWKGSDEDRETAQKLGRKMRYFANAVRIACKKPNGEVATYEPAVKIFGMSEKIAVCLLDHTQNEDYGDITDPKTGRNVRIKRTGKGIHTTRYGDPVPRPATSAVQNFEELKKQIVDLNEYVNRTRKTAEEINNIIQNIDTENSDGTEAVEPDAETAPPTQNASKPTGWDDSDAPATTTKKQDPKPEPTKTEAAPATTGKLSIKDRVRQLRNKQ